MKEKAIGVMDPETLKHIKENVEKDCSCHWCENYRAFARVLYQWAVE